MVTLKAYTDYHNSYKAHGPITNNNTVTVKAMETCSLFLQSISVRSAQHVFLKLGNRIQTVILSSTNVQMMFLNQTL